MAESSDRRTGDERVDASDEGSARPNRERRARGGPSLSEKLQRDEPMRYMKFTISVFVALGFGYWLTFFLANELASGSGLGGFAGGGALILGLLFAPLVAIVTGLVVGRDLDADEATVAATNGIASAIGVVAMALLLFILVSIENGGGGGGGGGDFPTGLVIGFLLGVGATGALGAYVTDKFGSLVR